MTTGNDDVVRQCDYLLIVATQSEREMLKQAAKELNIPFRRASGRYGRYYVVGDFDTSRVIAVRLDSMGPFFFGGSASKAILYQLETQATAIINLGMAFGVDSDAQAYGDIVVSTSVIPYDF